MPKTPNANLDLEDEELTPTPEAESKPKKASLDEDEAPASTKPKGSAASGDDDEDDTDSVEFGDESEYKRPGQLDRVDPEKGKYVRFAILPHVKMKRTFIHYQQGKGYARCHSEFDKKGNVVKQAKCCARLGGSERRYGVLVVQYTSIDPKTGKFLADVDVENIEFEIRVFIFGSKIYRTLGEQPEEGQVVEDLDFKATKGADKKLAVNRISSKANWKKIESLKKAVEDAVRPFTDGKEVSRQLGRKMTPGEMAVFIGEKAADEGSAMDDLD